MCATSKATAPAIPLQLRVRSSSTCKIISGKTFLAFQTPPPPKKKKNSSLIFRMS